MSETIAKSPDTLRENRVPPGQRVVRNFPVLQAGGINKIDMATWRFHLTGLVEEERALTYEEFTDLPHIKVLSDIHCVTGWSRLDNLWEGVATEVMKTLVKIKDGARFVIIHAAGDFTTNLKIEEFFAEDALFAVTHNGKPLDAAHGAPVRLVVPRLYFWKSVKWVTGVEFVADDTPGFWESRGYHNHGDPWKEERYGD